MSEWEINIFFFETLRPEWGSNPRSPTFQAGCINHCTERVRSSHQRSKNAQIILKTCWLGRLLPANMIRRTNVGLVLDQRRRRSSTPTQHWFSQHDMTLAQH